MPLFIPAEWEQGRFSYLFSYILPSKSPLEWQPFTRTLAIGYLLFWSLREVRKLRTKTLCTSESCEFCETFKFLLDPVNILSLLKYQSPAFSFVLSSASPVRNSVWSGQLNSAWLTRWNAAEIVLQKRSKIKITIVFLGEAHLSNLDKSWSSIMTIFRVIRQTNHYLNFWRVRIYSRLKPTCFSSPCHVFFLIPATEEDPLELYLQERYQAPVYHVYHQLNLKWGGIGSDGYSGQHFTKRRCCRHSILLAVPFHNYTNVFL